MAARGGNDDGRVSPAVVFTQIGSTDQKLYFRVSWAAHCDSPRC
jgi:hypothetical protein